MLRILLVIGLFFGVGFTDGAVAQVTRGVSATSLEEILKSAGYTPKMTKSEQLGGAYASMEGGGYLFHAEAAECAAENCSILFLFANFNLDRDITLKDYQTINSYNDTEFLGRAYINVKERQVGIDLVFDLRGGVDREYIRLKALQFPELIQTFVDRFRKAMDEG
ncbi:MAG: YbjN domain-containing protein [Alphaproteobacteria bacterium]|nr:YbjN domain-containing protein [Alphaproteobacteria bacterium]